MGVEFMRTALASADLRGREKIVRPEFGGHLPAVPTGLYFWPNGVGSRTLIVPADIGTAS
jgi:hypothetical protein